MPPNQREVQRKLMKKYNISFDGPIDTIKNPHWPSDCDTRFDNIKRLGKYEYSQYQQSITADGSRFPWRSQAQRRAKRIAEKATQCIEGRKNESGWRLSLESEIMARFSVEIACCNCRGRLWRSEQEVIVDAEDDIDDYNSLKARQSRRRPCNCNPNNIAQDIPEQGISPLFDDRAEEAIRYSGELRSDLPKREDRPDRVYGLRVTERLSRLLQSVEDTNEDIKVSPFKSDGDPLVFPFLVIEAKSEKGSDSVSDTQVQTGFAIRELLSIQYQLIQAAGEDMDRVVGPLVWFLSYKGEQWRVSAAYVHDQNDKIYYRVVRLWTGSIDSQDCALQLLLILDYIVDWARDAYREGIVSSLQKISSSDTRSLARDDDIFSLAGNLRGRTPGIADPNQDESGHFVGDPMHAFDCHAAAFRDARFIQSRFLGLIITKENVEEFLQTGSSDEETRTPTASLLKACQYGCRVKAYMLDDLELQWTGTDRSVGVMRPDETFIVVITVVYCIRTNWDQVRELNYLAVSESLIKDLGEIGRIPSPSAQVLGRLLTVETLAGFEDLLRRTARDNLRVCVSELCLSTESVSDDKSNSSKVWKILPTVAPEDSNNVNRKMVIKRRSGSSARDFFFSLFLKHKVGRNDPNASMFRISSVLDQLLKPKHLLQNRTRLSDETWPNKFCTNLKEVEMKGLIYFRSTMPPRQRTTRLCVFIMEPSYCDSGIPPLLLIGGPKLHFVLVANKDKVRVGNTHNPKMMVSNGNIGFEKDTNALSTSLEKPFDPSSGMSLSRWDILTKGCSKFLAIEEMDVPLDRPFMRHRHQISLRAILLNRTKKITLVHDAEAIAKEDDDDWRKHRGLMAAPSGSKSGMKSKSRNQYYSRESAPSPSERRGAKRPMTTAAETAEEDESSQHTTRRFKRRNDYPQPRVSAQSNKNS